MNYYFLAAGILSLIALLGHLTMGYKLYLKPVLDSDLDDVPKSIMKGLFHYVSVFQILSSLVMIGNAVSCTMDNCLINSQATIRFIALNYAGFAIVQLIQASTSKIDKSFSKLFQWIFWLFIAAMAFSGMN